MGKLFPVWAMVAVAVAARGDASLGSNAYVQGGLVGHYDGIDNAGTGVHDPDAAAWKDLAGALGDGALGAGAVWADGTCWTNAANGQPVTLGAALSSVVATKTFTVELVLKPDAVNVRRTLLGNYSSAQNFNIESYSDARIRCYYAGSPDWYPGAKLVAGATSTVTLVTTPSAQTFYTNGVSAATRTGAIGAALTAGPSTIVGGELARADMAFRGAYYAVRVYNRPLSPEEIAWNHAIDESRFRGKSLTLFAVLGSPGNYGAPEPAYGSYGTDAETNVSFSIAASLTTDPGDGARIVDGDFGDGARVLYRGYTVRGASGETLAGSPSEEAFARQVAGTEMVVWNFAPQSRLVADAGAGGTVRIGEGAARACVTNWVEEGMALTVAAVPDEGYGLAYWSCDDLAGVSISGAVCTVTLTAPKTVTAHFKPLADPLLDFHARSYVQDGLIGHWDAIDNVAYGIAHDSDTVNWTELTTGGSFWVRDMHFDANSLVAAQSNANWASINYGGRSRFYDAITNGSYSMEIAYACEALTGKGNNGYINNNTLMETVQDRGIAMGGANRISFTAPNSSYVSSQTVTYNLPGWPLMIPCTNTIVCTHDADVISLWVNGAKKNSVAGVRPPASFTWNWYLNRNYFINCGINGRYYGFRIYARPLTEAEAAHNHAIDRVRFCDGAEFYYTVCGSPVKYGAPEPAYGTYACPPRTEVAFSMTNALETYAPDSVRAVNRGDGVRAAYTGYKARNAYTVIGEGVEEQVTLVITNAGTSFTWEFADQYRAVLSAGLGGTVKFNGGEAGLHLTNWFAAGSAQTVTAVAEEGYTFYAWSGDAAISDNTAASAVITMTQPKALVAIFQSDVHEPATCVWKSSSKTGNWNDPSNWEGGAAPGKGDTVILTNASATVIALDTPTPELALLVVSNRANATTTLLASNWNTRIQAAEIVVGTNGVIRCAGGFVDGQMSNRVWCAAGAMRIEAGGRIDADAGGYGPANGPGWVPGANNSESSDRGGSHGGRQGADRWALQSLPPAAIYGSAEAPAAPGTGSYSYNGGGAVRLEVAGALTIDGVVSANSGGSRPTGSGGSVSINCETIRGAGLVSASAGRYAYPATGNFGSSGVSGNAGGGGGRIAVHYDPEAQNACDCTILFEARGTPVATGAARSNLSGGLGTVWFTDARFVTSPLRHSGILCVPDFTEWRPAELRVDGWAGFPPGFMLDVDGGLVCTNMDAAGAGLELDASTLAVGGDALVRGAGIRLFNGASMQIAGNLVQETARDASGICRTYHAGEVWCHPAPTNAAAADGVGARIEIGGAWLMATNTYARLMCEYTNGAVVRVACRHLLMDAGAVIDADRMGWRHGYGPGTPPSGIYGASHGGHGGAFKNYVPRPTYGDEQQPRYPGSGSHDVKWEGGGVIWVEAARRMKLDGVLTASATTPRAYWCSGAAGGTVYLSCGRLEESTGAIRATGSSGAEYGRPGGGGRIAIWSVSGSTNGLALSVACGANPFPKSGESLAEDGTIYFGRLPATGLVILLQ